MSTFTLDDVAIVHLLLLFILIHKITLLQKHINCISDGNKKVKIFTPILNSMKFSKAQNQQLIKPKSLKPDIKTTKERRITTNWFSAREIQWKDQAKQNERSAKIYL